MAKGINKVILIGRTGSDPEVRYQPNGAAVANLSLATDESYNDRASGQKVERTEWHRLVAFAGLAEIIKQYVKKGALLYIEGRLQTRKWQDNTGQDRYTTEIVLSDMQMLGSKQDNSPPANQPPNNQARQPQQGYGHQNTYGSPHMEGGYDRSI